MYRNAKLLADFDEVVRPYNGFFKSLQTLYVRRGAWELVPFVKRGTKLTEKDVRELARAYQLEKLYFYMPKHEKETKKAGSYTPRTQNGKLNTRLTTEYL